MDCHRCSTECNTTEHLMEFGGERSYITLCPDCFELYAHALVEEDSEDEESDEESNGESDDEEVGDPCEPVLVFVVEDAGDPK